jgi:hypothetical protein
VFDNKVKSNGLEYRYRAFVKWFTTSIFRDVENTTWQNDTLKVIIFAAMFHIV